MDQSADLYEQLIAHGLRDAAPYAVVMAYRVRFYMDMNAREAMHVIELRTSPQGHPSYRRVCQLMHRAIAEDGRPSRHRRRDAVRRSLEVELERLQSERNLEKRSEAADRRLLSRLVLAPVARVLVQERQRLERLHPIEEQHAVEVIGLVLDDARRKIVRAQLDAPALADRARAP